MAADRTTRPPLCVTVSCEVRTPVRVAGLGPWLAAAAPARARGDVAIAIVGDARIRSLNRQYRGADYATDVLSFPAGDAPWLGDIAIAAGVARRQAARAGHSFATEARVLALHGLLHLLGYDHEQDGGEMAAIEARLRKRAGLPIGLIEREAAGPVRPPRRRTS